MISLPLHYDPAEIRRAISILTEVGQAYELRILSTPWGTVRGYYTDYERMARAAAYMSGRAQGVYLTLNPVARDLLARAANRLAKYARETTSDSGIITRRWLPIDYDAVRHAGISSTGEEHQQALDRAFESRDWLTLQGWPGPVVADSGNGAHLLYRVDLLNDAGATNLLRDCLRALSFRFDDERVKVDTGNYNASRIWKLYGTLVCKGDSIPERPHRLARILDVPEPTQVVPVPLLQSLATQVPKPPPGPVRTGAHLGGGEWLDVEAWISQNGIPVRHRKTWNGGNVWVLARCVWNPEHTDNASYVVQFPSGAIAAGCHHSSCQGRGWVEMREAVEPGYRQQMRRPRSQQRRSGYRSRSSHPRIQVPGGSVSI